MSQVTFTDAIDEMRGKFSKNGKIIFRKKKYHSITGAILAEGPQESYTIDKPRDFEKNPQTGAELENVKLFTDSKARATEIMNAGKVTDDELAAMSLAERTRTLQLREQLNDYTRRFYAQFKRPDSEAPFEKKPRPGSTKLRRNTYHKIDNFIQAIEREKLKNGH
jgi:hypothetical protein